MKRWSIKFKIIFWYTLFFALLIVSNLYFLNSSASNVLTDRAKTDLKNATIEVIDYIKIEDDGIYIEEDDEIEKRFNFYHDGAEFLLYKNNVLVFGNVPNDFDASTSILLNKVQSTELNGMTWLVYDVAMEDNYVLRGIYDFNSMMSSIDQVIMIAGVLSPIIILISSIGGFIIIKRSFRPIQDIYRTASLIKDEEDYSKRIVTSFSRDEVYSLADMVNQMLDRVERSINREKRFSSNVSHELRTPLTVMKAQAEYMFSKANAVKEKEDIRTIIQQISYMENIVTQLLEITRTRQLSSNDMEQINLYEIIQLTADSFSTQLDSKKISLNIKKSSVETTIICNQTMMIRVFSNLIANAIKYNSSMGEIDISFAVEGQFIITNVSDNGMGIPKEHIEKIFDSFYQTDDSRTQNEFSFGLGLALVKEVVNIHGGDIKVESEEHKGTTFKVYLPLSESKIKR